MGDRLCCYKDGDVMSQRRILLGSWMLLAIILLFVHIVLLVGIPVFVIGLVYWKKRRIARDAQLAEQLRLNRIARDAQLAEQLRLDEFGSLTPTQFEHAVAALFNSRGYRVQVVGGAGDLMADLSGVDPNGEPVIIQCKRYTVTNKVNSGMIQQFIGMSHVHHHIDQMIYVTTSSYTKDAVALGQAHNVTMLDGVALAKMANQYAPNA